MKANNALFNLITDSKEIFRSSSHKHNPFSKEENLQLQNVIERIKDNFIIDIYKPTIKKNDKKILNELIKDYLENEKDNFNDYYIYLLCWNINKFKPIKKFKKNNKILLFSFFEYQPDFFDFNSETKKIFKLFYSHNDCKEKISYILLKIYLSNYTKASQYFTELFKQYLITAKCINHINLFFNVYYAGIYGSCNIHFYKYKSFSQRMIDCFRIHSSILQTNYFEDAWFLWMIKYADVTNITVIQDLLSMEYSSYNFFNKCSDFEKILILSRIILKNFSKGNDIVELYNDYLQNLFPFDPLIPENWIFICNIKQLKQLIKSSNILQNLLVSNKRLLYFESIDNEIKIYSYKEK